MLSTCIIASLQILVAHHNIFLRLFLCRKQWLNRRCEITQWQSGTRNNEAKKIIADFFLL